MKFKSETELQAFLDDKPFFQNADCFCLGNSMTEAGSIIRQMIESTDKSGKAGTDNVAVDTGCVK